MSIVTSGKEPPVSRESAIKPNAVIAKNSGGPNFTARSARGGATNMRSATEIVPATKEPTAVTKRAAPARPRFVSW